MKQAIATKRAKRRISPMEILSVSLVRFSAALTIGVLFLILGYILWNGFFYNNRHEYPVTSYAATEFDGLVAVVNKDVRVDELPLPTVAEIFSDEYTTWKKASSQDIDLYPFIDGASADAALKALGLESSGELTEIVDADPSAEAGTPAIIQSVLEHTGAVAILSASSYAALSESDRQAVKRLRVRPISLGVNAEVTALRDNKKVSVIDEAALGRLYRGEVATWAAFDGHDLPVRVVIPPADSPLYAQAVSAGYRAGRDGAAAGSGFLLAPSVDEYYRLIADTPGAVGLVPYSRIKAGGLSLVKVARQETGRNLSLAYILEPPKESGKIGGISTIILNTLAMILLTLLFAVPPGLFAAVYLVEYAREGRLVRLIRLGTETLAGIPSIIFGLFGLLIFVQGFGWGISLISGSLTVTLMILPTIVRTAEEALKSVPRSLQEGSLALGATKVQTIFRVALPAALPAIISGVILAAGRALGETAALIYTMGSDYGLTGGLLSSTRTLAVHIYLLIAEGISSDRAFAAGAVLVFFILAINTAARFLVNRVGRMTRA